MFNFYLMPVLCTQLNCTFGESIKQYSFSSRNFGAGEGKRAADAHLTQCSSLYIPPMS